MFRNGVDPTASFGSLAAMFAAAMCVSNAHAEEQQGWIKPGTEAIQIKAGGYLAYFNTETRINGSRAGGPGTDLEDALGLDSDYATFFADAYWRFAPRHRVGLGYYSVQRDGTRTASRNIEIGDGNVVAAGATVETSFDFDVYPIYYAYSFLKTPQHELAASVGVNWHRIDLSFTASAFASGGSASGQVSGSADLPVPAVGARYDFYLNDRWSFGAGGQFFALDIDDLGFTGSFYSVGADMRYWIWNNIGVGVALNAVSFDIEVDNDDWKGTLEMDYWGPQAFLTARF
jgi:hypothetical protein